MIILLFLSWLLADASNGISIVVLLVLTITGWVWIYILATQATIVPKNPIKIDKVMNLVSFINDCLLRFLFPIGV